MSKEVRKRKRRKTGKPLPQAAKSGKGGAASEKKPQTFSRDFGKIFLDKEGRWFHEGVEITHPRTIELFSRCVVRARDRGYLLEIGPERARIEVEDTPYMVRSVEFKNGKAMLELNDHSLEELTPDTVRQGKDNVLYCEVKSGQFPARFLRPAYYQIMTCLDEDDKGYFLNLAGKRCYIGRE